MIRTPSNEPVNGRWLLSGIAGRGAAAVVYRAFDLVAEEVVAVKAMTRAGRWARPGARARREFIDLARVRHPNLVETYELGAAEQGPLPRGTAFFTMELLDQPPLPWVAKDPRSLAHLALGLLAGLECIHSHGLVHRDVKPSNVLLDMRHGEAARIKLSDLGLAAPPSSREAGLSGTLQYAAPEAIAGGRIDRRSDLYSLGVVLFEAAVGVLPFDAADPAAALEWHLGSRSRERGAARGLPPTLARVVGRLLSSCPDARFPSAREAWEEIAEAVPAETERCVPAGEDADGPLTGRAEEKAALARWLRQASRNGGHLRIIGPGGSGLSRLAREAALLGRAQRWSVHLSVCMEGAPPFFAFYRALREILLERCRWDDVKCGSALGRLHQKDLLAILGGPAFWSARTRARPEAGHPLAVALASFLSENVRLRPLLLVLDDLDCADDTVRSVVGEIDARGRSERPPLMIVSTTRGDGSGASSFRGAGDARGARSDAGPCHGLMRREAQNVSNGSARERRSRAPTGGDELRIGSIAPAECRTLLEALPGIGSLGPIETEAVVTASAGMPGRLVRIARSVAGRQRPLFPPLREPAAIPFAALLRSRCE